MPDSALLERTNVDPSNPVPLHVQLSASLRKRISEGDLPPGDPRQTARPLGSFGAADIAALSPEQYTELARGTPMRRIGYDGLRRNACISLGATRQVSADVLTRLANDPNPQVREAADWALRRLKP